MAKNCTLALSNELIFDERPSTPIGAIFITRLDDVSLCQSIIFHKSPIGSITCAASVYDLAAYFSGVWWMPLLDSTHCYCANYHNDAA